MTYDIGSHMNPRKKGGSRLEVLVISHDFGYDLLYRYTQKSPGGWPPKTGSSALEPIAWSWRYTDAAPRLRNSSNGSKFACACERERMTSVTCARLISRVSWWTVFSNKKSGKLVWCIEFQNAKNRKQDQEDGVPCRGLLSNYVLGLLDSSTSAQAKRIQLKLCSLPWFLGLSRPPAAEKEGLFGHLRACAALCCPNPQRLRQVKRPHQGCFIKA